MKYDKVYAKQTFSNIAKFVPVSDLALEDIGVDVTWANVSGKPTTFAPTIGETATTAKAGNWLPPDVTTTTKGLMLATHLTKLNGIQEGANLLNIGATATTAAAGNHTHGLASGTVSGFMVNTDKAKLDAIAAGATANSPATVAPLANGTAAVGTSALYTRQDHVHPLQASVATLTTGRTIGLSGGATGTSAAFNGSGNATIPVTLAAPTATVRGGILKQPALADIDDRPVDRADFNALVALLRNAEIITT